MKLQQLRYISAMRRHNLNVSETADALFTSQPGISKQIKLLEEELGIELYVRSGKQMSAMTAVGAQITQLADDILARVAEIKTVARESANPHLGALRIGTTHTQARYVLPPVVKQFGERYPQVSLELHQGTPNQLSEMLRHGLVDLVIATESLEVFDEFVQLPCYRWERAVLVPYDHPLHKLARLDGISLEAVVKYPLISYVFAFTGQSPLDLAFSERNLTPKIALTAVDADVIKTYVRQGLGVGIIAEMAYDAKVDDDLVILEGTNILPSSVTHICLPPGRKQRAYTYQFMHIFANHLDAQTVDKACSLEDAQAREALFADLRLPSY